MNYSDLFVVIALAAALYGLIVALARQKQFLSRAVNPHRGPWLLAGLTCLWFGLGLLRLESPSWDPHDILGVLASLVTDAPLSTRGKMAVVGVLLGLLFIVLVVWCRISYPRDPSTFRRPQHRTKAFRYYVSSLRGGLDYGVLMRPGQERLEERFEARHIRRAIEHVPRVPGVNERVVRTMDDQIAFWRATAERIHDSMPQLDSAISPAHQGSNRRIVFDTEYGALFFAYLRPPIVGSADNEPIFVFAAALSQEAVNLKTADLHFELLVKALKQIDMNVRVG